MTFRSEAIGQALKELKQEKEFLQGKLAELRNKRRENEKTNETVSSKLMHTKELNEKMQETSKVAQHKESQTQVLANSYEAEIKKNRQQASDVTRSIENEGATKMKELEQFEENLTQVKDKLLWGRKFYEPDSLRQNISDLEDECKVLKGKASALESEDDTLCQKLKQLELHNNRSSREAEWDIPLEIRDTLSELLQEEYSRIESKLQELSEGLEVAQRIMSDLLAS